MAPGNDNGRQRCQNETTSLQSDFQNGPQNHEASKFYENVFLQPLSKQIFIFRTLTTPKIKDTQNFT